MLIYEGTIEIVSFGTEEYASEILDYAERIDVDELTVEFDGVKYVCEALRLDGATLYGDKMMPGDLWAEYPFCLVSRDPSPIVPEVRNEIWAEEGVHTVKIYDSEDSGDDSEDSDYTSCEYPAITIELEPEPRYGGTLSVPVVDGKIGASWQTIKDAVLNGGVVLVEKDEHEGSYSYNLQYITQVGESISGTYYINAKTLDSDEILFYSTRKATNHPTIAGPSSDEVGTGEVDYMTLQE